MYIYIYISGIDLGGGCGQKVELVLYFFEKFQTVELDFFPKKWVFMAFLCDNLSNFLKFLKKLRKYTVFDKNFDVFAEFFQKFSEFFQKISKNSAFGAFGAEKVERVLCFLPKKVEQAPPPKSIPDIYIYIYIYISIPIKGIIRP